MREAVDRQRDPCAPLPVSIGVLSRVPVPGRCKTRLVARLGPRGAAELQRAMLADVLASLLSIPAARHVLFADSAASAADFASVDVEHWELAPQHGNDLGARIVSALNFLARDGGSAVLFGSDAPLLPLAELRAAVEDFSSPDRVLLGPAFDGGYYAIGVTNLVPELFADVPWSTSGVLAATRERCRKLGLSVLELPRAHDVDEPDDLLRLARALEQSPGSAPRTAAQLKRMRW